MQNNIAYKYDEDENRFITISKDELLNDLISIRLDDIIAFNEDVGNKLDINSKIKLEKFLDNIENNEKLRENKKSELKIILYNNRNFVEMIFGNQCWSWFGSETVIYEYMCCVGPM